VRLESSGFSGNRAEDALNLIRSGFAFRGVSILEAASDAFDCDFCEGQMVGGRIGGVGGDGIDVSGSTVRVEGVVLEDIRDKAISVGEASHLVARGVHIRGVGTAVAGKDGSEVIFEDSEVSDVRHAAIMAYTKKPTYGPGHVSARNIAMTRVGRKAVAQHGSRIHIDGTLQTSEDVDVEDLYERGYMKK
jgi:tetrahydrodipicolinate N-succinyltransferase